jgi:hypothetical protein
MKSDTFEVTYYIDGRGDREHTIVLELEEYDGEPELCRVWLVSPYRSKWRTRRRRLNEVACAKTDWWLCIYQAARQEVWRRLVATRHAVRDLILASGEEMAERRRDDALLRKA